METSKNGKKFREMIWMDNTLIKGPYFSRKNDAAAWKANKLNERTKLQILGEEYKTQSKLSFSEFSLPWLEQKIKPLKAPSTFKDYERILRVHILPVLGNVPLKSVKVREADQLVLALHKKGTSPKGIQNILGVLKQILNEAEKCEEVLKNHLRQYKTPKVPQRDYKYWSDSEIRQFLLTSRNDPYYQYFLTALYTGMRKGEIAGLTWDCIDFERNLITVKGTLDKFGYRASTKTGKIRYVPINTFLKKILLEMFKNRSDNNSTFVFLLKDQPIDTNHLYRIFQKLQTKARIDKRIRVHDLRHTFASQFMMKGLGSLYDLSQVLGHSDTKMTQRYAHLSPQHLSGVTQNLKFGVEEDLSRNLPLSYPRPHFEALSDDNVMEMRKV